ncbi:AMIN-like domain-containing (lipo)protein [Corynebacterium sp. 335C]
MSSTTRTRRPLRIAAAAAAAGLLAFAAACGTASGEESAGQDNRGAVSLKEANEAAGGASADPSAGEDADGAGDGEDSETSDDGGDSGKDGDEAKDGTGADSQGDRVALDDDATDEPFSMETKDVLPEGSGFAVTDVRAGAHEGYDRIVVELSGDGLAGYHVGYEQTPAEQGRGLPIEHPGDQALVLYVRGVGYPFELGVEDLTVGTLTPERTGAVVQVQGEGMFEGDAQYVISIKGERRPFRVLHLEDPQRIVIDVQTEG